MSKSARKFFFTGVLLAFFLPAVFADADRPFDHSMWQEFLTSYVNKNGEVNYRAVAENPALLKKYLKSIRKIKPSEFQKNWPREERLALLLNLYHAGLINAIRKHYPVREVHDIPNFWSEKCVRLGIASWSLDDIRTIQLMQTFRDEKIHFVLSCGAQSCPRLRQEAFTGPKVEGQILLAVKEFVNDQAKNAIVSGRKKIKISRLFKWYEKDFQMDFGTFENDQGYSQKDFAVLSFLFYYLENADQVHYLESSKVKINYQSFNWALNDWVPTSSK